MQKCLGGGTVTKKVSNLSDIVVDMCAFTEIDVT